MFRPADPKAGVLERLAPFAFAAGLTPDGVAAVERLVSPVEFRSGTALLDVGGACDPLVLVEKGSIRVFQRTEGGREISLYRVEPGESCVLAMASILGETSYPATAVVDDDLRGLAVPAPLFRELYATQPSLQRFVMDLMCSRLAVLMALVTEVAFERMDRRLAHYLLGEAGRSPGVLAPVERTHEQIAAELGTAREVVTRLLRSFEDRGLVELRRGRVLVRDAERLREEA